MGWEFQGICGCTAFREDLTDNTINFIFRSKVIALLFMSLEIKIRNTLRLPNFRVHKRVPDSVAVNADT
jgi:hypothetical protein